MSPRKKKDWRPLPITEKQKFRLQREGIPYRANMTRGEASDLIGTTMPLDQEQARILKLFKVPGYEKLSETAANETIRKIFLNEANVEKWDNRPMENDQKEVFAFFKVPVKRGMTHKEAETFIENLLEDEQKEKAWLKYEEEQSDREFWFDENFETINEDADLYDCKTISKSRFKRAVESLEADGLTLEQIEDDIGLIFQRALKLHPDLSLKPSPGTQKGNTRPLYSQSQRSEAQLGRNGKISRAIRRAFIFLFRILLIFVGFGFVFLGGAMGMDIWQTHGTLKTLLAVIPLGTGLLGTSLLWWSILGLRKSEGSGSANSTL